MMSNPERSGLFKKSAGLWLFLFMASGIAYAQSTLEYGTLVGGITAASKAAKEKSKGDNQQEASQAPGAGGLAAGAMTNLYEQSSQALSAKGSSLLGSLGSGSKTVPEEPKDKNITETQPAESPNNTSAQTDAFVTLHLKEGAVIKGKMVEEKDDYVKVDTEGIVVTYFKEEIDHIER